MKYYKKIVWIVLIWSLLVLTYVTTQFRIEDMTLAKGEVFSFDENWEIIWQDGTHATEDLPYLGTSQAGERVVMENTLPEAYWGMTMSFLSADKEFRVLIDDVCVYEFGMADERQFGHTPGSIVNFVDIPWNLSEGNIRIEMTAPYDDYAARINSIEVGNRDVLILKLLKDNAFEIFCSFIIVICAITFALLFVVRKVSKQDTAGVEYICGYCIVVAIYYLIETKTLSIFYGNQTLYSIVVFLCLMCIPFWLTLYYANGTLKEYTKRWNCILAICCLNILLQFMLQMLNIFDFMDMAFASHVLLALSFLAVAKSYFDILRQKPMREIRIELIAFIIVSIGGAIDIVRMYTIGVGDMGKYSRIGNTAFSLILLYMHFKRLMVGYSESVEENARLMKREMEYIEKKNEQLEQAYALAEEARQAALAADAAKGKFLAHMSHEIRTPINAVLGMNTMILRETTDMQIKEYALDIQSAGQNLLALINDILDFSKIESGKLEIISVEYDVSSMIHDISNMIAAKVKDKNLEFYIEIDEQLPSKLFGDDVRIRQILVNLLNNAVKYTHAGSVTLRIDGEKSDGRVLLNCSVKDTGIGIKEEDISKLFMEFERIEEKRNRGIEGTGLGINITMQLLTLMGSTLQVESEYGKGSRFYFTLEQQIVDSTPVGNLTERLTQQATDYSYMEVFTAPDAQILVVDDNAMNLKVFVSLLKTTKVQIDVANGGYECLEMVCKKRYDLIFLDHMMPDLDGVETLHKMRTLDKYMCQNTPVIALTANAITGAKEMYLEEGFDAFLSKPINPEKLEQLILLLLPRELLSFDVVEQKEHGEKNVPQQINANIQEDSLPMVDGIDWSYGLLHLRDEELLQETVADFYKAIIPEAETLEGFYEGLKGENVLDMLNQYRIKVHAMKSSANMIGATVIGGMAKMLEEAAKSANLELIETLTPIFLREWRSYKEKLSICVSNSLPKKEIDDFTVILAYLEMLRVSMLEMDIDGMDSGMEKLEQYIFPENLQQQIDKLSVLVTELKDEEAVALIEELMKQMKSNREDE